MTAEELLLIESANMKIASRGRAKSGKPDHESEEDLIASANARISNRVSQAKTNKTRGDGRPEGDAVVEAVNARVSARARAKAPKEPMSMMLEEEVYINQEEEVVIASVLEDEDADMSFSF